MARVGQLGVVIGLLWLVITLIGLFPGLIAFPPTPGLGVMQILMVNFGFSVLIFGAMIYVKFIFYAESRLTLAQKIGIRLSLTSLVMMVVISLADVLNFGSHLRSLNEEILFGGIQMVGVLIFLGVASLGIMIFAVAGTPTLPSD